MLFDTHAHLDSRRFDKDREKVIKNLYKNEVSLVVNPGVDFASSVKAVFLANKYDNVYAAVGVHPHEAKGMDDNTIDILKELSNKEKVIAIGEIGLDYHYDNSPREVQRRRFKEQIKLAKEINLPIIVHDRDAHQDVFEIIKEEADTNLKGVIHCYSGSVQMAKKYVDMGFYISLAGPVTFKNAKTPKKVVEGIPLDKLLIETDSPYLTPHPHRGKRNEPLYVRFVASTIAEIKGISFEKVAKQTLKNGKDIFNIK